jgi:transcriptional regulator of arginine metabolism
MHIYAMNNLKERRQRAIADLIRTGPPANQEELAERLERLGFAVTQATVSRDLEQLGSVKVRRDGRLSYVLPEQAASGSAALRLASVVRDWVRSIDCAANLAVIKTPPGTAHLVGVALDQAGPALVVGTICGDDTIFVACRTDADARAFAKQLEAMRYGAAA